MQRYYNFPRPLQDKQRLKCHFSGLLMIPCNMTCLEPDIGTPGLRHLLTTGDAIQTAILSEQRPRLLEMKWNI